MITLKNKNLTVSVDEMGAELKSIIKDQKEFIWQGHPEIWSGSAPILFPICGGLKEDKFIFEGREYHLPKHGFARTSLFDVDKLADASVTLLLKSDKETLKAYPFEFELRVTFSLDGDSVKTTYSVTNASKGDMYFSIGSHEAYSTPEGIEDYDVIFPNKETLNAVLLDGNLLEKNTLPIIKDCDVLPLYDKYFTVDALVFTDLKSKSATLRNRKTGKFVRVDFPEKDYFLLWHKPNSPYICLEPWAGIPDFQDSDFDITKKQGIIHLTKGENYTVTHCITLGTE